MNGHILYEAMGQIRPGYIEEAEKHPFPKPKWKRMAPMAACLLLVIGLLPVFVSQLTGTAGQVLPATSEVIPAETIITDERLFYQSDGLQKGLDQTAILLGVSCFLIPFLCLVRNVKPKTTHLVSSLLYLAYLLVCIGSAWYSVSQSWWTNLYCDLPAMFRNGVILLIILLMINGLCYLKKRRIAALLSLLSCVLFLMEPPAKHDLIDRNAVVSVETKFDSQALLGLIEQHGGRRTTATQRNNPIYEGTIAVINMADGSYYALAALHTNDFSFRPGNFGEDNTEFHLIAYGTNGRTTGEAWELDYRIEDPLWELMQNAAETEVTP